MSEGRSEQIRAAVREAAEKGRIECARALAVARRLKVEPRRVGEACNAERIKVVRCQLGCFG